MSAAQATTKSAQPVLAVMEALCGFATGATNKDLAEACKTTAVVITRATQTLIAHGWCRKSEKQGAFTPRRSSRG
jgi:DNA-binding IclR family transcriptional regulator